MSTGTSGKAGLMGGGAPDFMGMANAQSQGQSNLLREQTYANRPDVYTPYGSYTWSHTPGSGTPPRYGAGTGGATDPNSVPDMSWFGGRANGSSSPFDQFNIWDPSTYGNFPGTQPPGAPPPDGGGKMTPTPGDPSTDPNAGYTPESWALDVNLSPEEQAALDQSRGIRSGMNQTALDMLGNGLSGQDVENATYGRMTSRLDPQWNQRQDQLRTQLYNQGLREGDTAFDQQMQNFGRDRNDAYQQAQWAAVQGGDASQAQQVNILNMLRGGNGPNMPGLPNFNQAGVAQAPDLIGASNAQAAYAAQNNPMNLVGQLAPYALGAYMLSDERLKTNIRRLDAEAIPGVKWATWEWKSGGHGKGVIAQDVAKVRPDLVMRGEDGFLRVDYSKIGA